MAQPPIQPADKPRRDPDLVLLYRLQNSKQVQKHPQKRSRAELEEDEGPDGWVIESRTIDRAPDGTSANQTKIYPVINKSIAQARGIAKGLEEFAAREREKQQQQQQEESNN